ncbi:MAG TPA: S8 family serine peptidase, partial [Ilumatobacteraceae bacterium]
MQKRSTGARRRALLIGAAAVATIVVTAPSAATASGRTFHATAALKPTSTISAPKSNSGRLAQSDPSLLGRTDPTPVNVVIKLDYDAAASYVGDVAGLPATSPAVTGVNLTGRSAAEKSYAAYTGKLDKSFRSSLASKVPSAVAGKSLETVYGGVSVKLPANQISKVLAIPGVVAVQSDTLNKTDAMPADDGTTGNSADHSNRGGGSSTPPPTTASTVESPTFIGAPTIWSQTGGQSLSGHGVIFGDLDTGIWPENPMLANNTALGTPPVAPSGQPRACNFGDNPLTLATDVFVCNDKVIGGEPFIDTYNAAVGGETFPNSARDSDGHGTHTTTTAAGDAIASAPIFGINRGPISGVAPGAWVIEYKVCGLLGCFGSDSVAAIQQAILDGVNVINYSISGGTSPYSDPVELAFLDAYDAGITVAAAAGNDGPTAGTVNHLAPWVITVAASTQTREFDSTLTVKSGADTATFTGTSLTAGISTQTPIVLAQNIPGYDALCSTALPAGAATGKLVACQRGVTGRIQKGYNVLQGGAAGMILYNLPLADTESDNHFLPAIHLADGTAFLAFLAAHPTGSTGAFTQGVKANGQGDVMAAFSSRGPGGQYLKPDITAPGVQILAGNTPVPD